jgi:flagellar biosynthetic protein FliQ
MQHRIAGRSGAISIGCARAAGVAPMQDFDVATILHGGMLTTLKMCLALLLAPLGAGLLVAVLQAVTQVNDSTVAFLPKLVASGVSAWIAGPFLSRTMSDYMHTVMDAMIAVGGQ